MACLEHYCVRCSTSIMNNNSQTQYCPKCGEPMSRVFDEDLSDHYAPEIEREYDEP